jgi:hypothetical protein
MSRRVRLGRLRSARGRHAHGHDHEGYMPSPPYAYPPVPMTPSEWQYRPPFPVGGITLPNPIESNPAIEPYVSRAMYSPFSGYGFVSNPGVPAMRAKDRRLMGSANMPPTMSGPLARNQIAHATMETPGQFHEHAMMSPPSISWEDDDSDLFDDNLGLDDLYGQVDDMGEDLLGLDSDDYETIAAARTFVNSHHYGADDDKKAARQAKRKLMWSNLFKRDQSGKTKAEKASQTATNVASELAQLQTAIDKLVFPRKAEARAAARDVRQTERELSRAERRLARVDVPERKPMSPWAVAGIAVGAAALVGGGVYLAMRK